MAPTRQHQCTECAKAFRVLAELKRHVAHVHSDERPHVCDVCDRTFKDVCDLRRHSTMHKKVKDFECDECHTFFVRRYDLGKHKLTKHAAAVGTTQNDDADDRPHVCPICGIRFKDSGNFSRHKKTHERDRKFQCPECHKFLSRKSDYPRHKRTCAQSADSGPAAQEAWFADETGDDLEESRADENPASGEDINMLEYDDAISSSGASHVCVVPAPPDEVVADGEARDATEPGLIINAEFIQVMDATAVDGSLHAHHGNGSIMQYRAHSDSSDDGDDAEAQSNDEQPSTLFVPWALPVVAFPLTRSDPHADFAAFSALENVFRRRVQSLEDQFQRLTLRQWMPLETLRDAFAFLSRVDLTKASMTCRRYRNLSSTFDTLRHIANLVVEPVARGRRFGSRDHPEWSAPTKSSVVLWYEFGHERAPGAFRTFRTVPKALEFVAQQGLLQTSYVENLAFRQTGVGDITNYIWQHLAKSMRTAEIGQWTIDGLRLEAVGRFGNVRGPLDAAKRLRSLTVRNSPYMPTQ